MGKISSILWKFGVFFRNRHLLRSNGLFDSNEQPLTARKGGTVCPIEAVVNGMVAIRRDGEIDAVVGRFLLRVRYGMEFMIAGYARVSMDKQNLPPQIGGSGADGLRADFSGPREISVFGSNRGGWDYACSLSSRVTY